MLAKLWKISNLDSTEYVFEVKYDGYRGLAGISGGRLAFLTRNGLDLSSRFPSIADAFSRLKVGEAVIDGEVVAFDAPGVSRFQQLMTPGAKMAFMAFDLLWLNGEDLRSRPLEERRARLESVLARAPQPLQLAERLSGTVAEARKEVQRRSLEGMIAKRRGSPYVGVRSSDWLKLKISQAQEVAIVGYLPISTGAKEIGALLIAVAESSGFRFAGKVGTGFTQAVRRQLWECLETDRLDRPSVIDPPKEKGAVWVKPRWVAQVSFGEWTRDGRMRHPVFQGLREDKKPSEAIRERAEEANEHDVSARSHRSAATPTPSVKLTHPDRVLFPKSQITKRDVFNYYREIAPFLLPALDGRPLVFQQWPKGITHPDIFRQHARGVPPWATTVEVQHERGKVRHLLVDRLETLLWLANQSALTFHVGAARVSRIKEPNWVSFDLDPPEGRWAQLVQLANSLRGFLEQLHLQSVPKTSGKRGLHVLVPLGPGYRHEQALEFAVAISETLSRGLPEIATTERSPSKRKGRIYVDVLQNGYGKTVVAPYSVRALERAPVSTPLQWTEVTPKLDPTRFNLRNLRQRLDQVGDLFAPALKGQQRLPDLQSVNKRND